MFSGPGNCSPGHLKPQKLPWSSLQSGFENTSMPCRDRRMSLLGLDWPTYQDCRGSQAPRPQVLRRTREPHQPGPDRLSCRSCRAWAGPVDRIPIVALSEGCLGKSQVIWERLRGSQGRLGGSLGRWAKNNLFLNKPNRNLGWAGSASDIQTHVSPTEIQTLYIPGTSNASRPWTSETHVGHFSQLTNPRKILGKSSESSEIHFQIWKIL